MIESEFAFLQVQVESVLAHASKPDQSQLGGTPEALDTIDVGLAPDEVVATMVDPQMLSTAHIDLTRILHEKRRSPV